MKITLQFRLQCLLLLFLLTGNSYRSCGQNNTQIRGFIDVSAGYSKDKLSFSLGEQDLFITSDLSDRLSFLGESVFKFDPASETKFSVSIERVVLKYNYKGNHNILIGKHHTPLNYWNDTYHHGRVFFPTIGRPQIFSSVFFPLHTTGISFQGLNLGKLRFGYDLMLGNGIGSTDVLDSNKGKSVTAAIHVKPREGMRVGVSYYYDAIPAGTDMHNHTTGSGAVFTSRLKEQLVTASVANFGKKWELLLESTLAMNKFDSTAMHQSAYSYLYTGYKVSEKITPYLRIDNLINLNDRSEAMLLPVKKTTWYMAGIRYQINYLAVIKVEYQRQYSGSKITGDSFTTQFAIGF